MKTDTNTAKPTAGVEWSAMMQNVQGVWVETGSGIQTELIARVEGKTMQEKMERGKLIAEAGTVYHETNLFPRELMELNQEMLQVLERVTTIFEQLPCKNSDWKMVDDIIAKAKGPNKG